MVTNNNFNSRFFNQLDVQNHVVTKRSHDKAKIQKEYHFYHLIPAQMQTWMVEPSNYQENTDIASYQMPFITEPDLAKRLVDGTIPPQEFSFILDEFFRFIDSRPTKLLSRKDYAQSAQTLYLDKIATRITSLKSFPLYNTLSQEIPLYTKYETIDDIFYDYQTLYHLITSTIQPSPIVAISHGDLCFSNAFFIPDTKQLLFIDPRGALTPDELYLDQYYDIAKLSHSICGNYDYFNAKRFQLGSPQGLQVTLSPQHPTYQQIFKTSLTKKHNYNYQLTRLYEASLFLSMLPLHIDYPPKVLGFILNAINIMEELKHEI
ncbi:MAG: hypothetical protein Q4A70_03005 [Candidatus Saccharibacteria bacterium]|nr:hypothetical protein [Candidatus Saccharibacteria bacterium]